MDEVTEGVEVNEKAFDAKLELAQLENELKDDPRYSDIRKRSFMIDPNEALA